MVKLSFKNINFSYNPENIVFDQMNLDVQPTNDKGHVMTLMGGSGSGKTTFLKLLVGMLKPQTGTIQLDPDHLIFSYVPQESVLFEHLTPMQNAEYFKHASKNKNRFDSKLFSHLTKVLEMDIVLKSGNSVKELSGGQKQRLSLLRALSIKPEVLLLDEPCTGLDADVKFSFLSNLHELTKELKLFTIYVTHHIEEASFIGNSVAFLNRKLKTNTVHTISVQTINEFINKPPSLDALRISSFPKLNILGVEQKNDHFILSETPTLYLSLTPDKIEEQSENSETITFSKFFYNDIYCSYKHINSGNKIVFNSKHNNPSDTLNIKFEGPFDVYDESGLYAGTSDKKITG